MLTQLREGESLVKRRAEMDTPIGERAGHESLRVLRANPMGLSGSGSDQSRGRHYGPSRIEPKAARSGEPVLALTTAVSIKEKGGD